jgi:hypothetical protein
MLMLIRIDELKLKLMLMLIGIGIDVIDDVWDVGLFGV